MLTACYVAVCKHNEICPFMSTNYLSVNIFLFKSLHKIIGRQQHVKLRLESLKSFSS